MRFAGAGRSEEDHVLARVKEVELADVLDQLKSYRAIGQPFGKANRTPAASLGHRAVTTLLRV